MRCKPTHLHAHTYTCTQTRWSFSDNYSSCRVRLQQAQLINTESPAPWPIHTIRVLPQTKTIASWQKTSTTQTVCRCSMTGMICKPVHDRQILHKALFTEDGSSRWACSHDNNVINTPLKASPELPSGKRVGGRAQLLNKNILLLLFRQKYRSFSTK